MEATSASPQVVISKARYRAVFDRQRQCLVELISSGNETNWLAHGEPYRFGAPFVNGTQEHEVFLTFVPQETTDRSTFRAVSPSGATRVAYSFHDEHIDIVAEIPVGCGPRAGIELDLNTLDLPTNTAWTEQVVPVVMYTDPEYAFAYLIWQRKDDDYLVMAVDSPFAAWRLKYDYRGRRLLGMQVLSQADDVVTRDGTQLPTVNKLRIKLAFANGIAECYRRLGDLLGITLVEFSISGGVVGSSLALTTIGNPRDVRVHRPDESMDSLTFSAGTAYLPLSVPGFYDVTTISDSGRHHTSRVLCHEQWDDLYTRCNDFSRQHFQHECGAFFRAIDRQSLSPEGKHTLSGIAFGDPWATDRTSCRTGEFGGFAGWAMIKQQLLFGPNAALTTAVERYIEHWALNKGHEESPYPGTVFKQPSEHRGRTYSAYHLYEQVNHVQYEVFLLDQLVDYYRLTKAASILEDAVNLAMHFISDHLAPNGMVYSQKTPDQPVQDYTTVDLPGVALLTLGRLLRDKGDPRGHHFLGWAERMADYLVTRGLESFPTEGDQTTEDGSIACTAATLLAAYLHLTPKPEYLRTGRHILELHDKLMLKGLDCRSNYSSFRCWELNFEADSWGPSINSGHGWTLWTAGAKVDLYRISGQTRWLREAYASFIAVLSNVDRNGGIYPCYTLEMIPGTPAFPGQGREPDLRRTTTYLAMDWPDSYSSSGTYALIRAEDCWSSISGVIVEDNTTINGVFDADGVFVSAAPLFDRLALSAVPPSWLTMRTKPGQEVTITFDVRAEQLDVHGGDVVRDERKSITCRADGTHLSLVSNGQPC